MSQNVRVNRFAAVFLIFFALGMISQLRAQTSGLGLNPAKVEVEINPGEERTVGFRIETPPSEIPVRGRLMLNLTDWTIDERASLAYLEPGALPDSAAPWVVFSPSAINTVSGDSHLVRVTVRVPETAEPGVYRCGIFVQERPPATPPSPGQHIVYFRFRYAFTLYVIVPPVTAKGELVDVWLDRHPDGLRMVYEIRNRGSLHLRPRISWSITGSDERIMASIENKETTVLLPHSRMILPSIVAPGLPPGRYEISAQVDFNDGSFVQRLRRPIEITPGSESLVSTWPSSDSRP